MDKAIIDVKIVTRISRNGKPYKCIVAIDVDGNEYILQFVNRR